MQRKIRKTVQTGFNFQCPEIICFHLYFYLVSTQYINYTNSLKTSALFLHCYKDYTELCCNSYLVHLAVPTMTCITKFLSWTAEKANEKASANYILLWIFAVPKFCRFLQKKSVCGSFLEEYFSDHQVLTVSTALQ